MTSILEILARNPFECGREEKENLLTERLVHLTELHYQKCKPYRNILNALGYEKNLVKSYYDLPFLPVSLFKDMSLRSIDEVDIFKTMTSSGTSGQAVSKIYLDKQTSGYQQKALVKIVSSLTGSARLPMLIIDSPSVIRDRSMFSARGAGILGFSIFGTDRTYALDDEMKIDIRGINAFLEKHRGERILMFGFTFMIWQHFFKELLKSGERPDLSGAVLIHGGGWKKLISEAISADAFKTRLTEVCGLREIHDYYGMVEQTGSIYIQCEEGHLHASLYSDVITRRYTDFSVCNIGESGIIQVVSVIPESYPGHSLLTEDEGVILGEDDCPCGRKGKYFKVFGRLKEAEIRGCSDTYAAKFDT